MRSLLSQARRLTMGSSALAAPLRARAPLLPLLRPLPPTRPLHSRCTCATDAVPPPSQPTSATPVSPVASSPSGAVDASSGAGGSGSSSGSGSGSSSGSSWSTRIGIVFFLSTAGVALFLGQWQVKRRVWKQDLIAKRTAAIRALPVELDEYLASRSAALSSLDDAAPGEDADECKRLRVRGRLLHSRTLLMGPRTPPSPDATSTAGAGPGYFLLTPLVLPDGRQLLINRGWCPSSQCVNGSRGHVETLRDEEEVEIIGVIRKGEKEPSSAKLLTNYDPLKAGSFVWLDLPLMAHMAGVRSVADDDAASSSFPLLLLDALEVRGGDGPGARVMRRRSEGDYLVFTTTPQLHAVYAATWFTLAVGLVVLTYVRFGKKGQEKAAKQALQMQQRAQRQKRTR